MQQTNGDTLLINEHEGMKLAPSYEAQKTTRVHRVGTITTGLCFIGYGILFLLHTSLGLFSYQTIFSFWPLILISLGVEVLLSAKLFSNFIYDKAGAFMMILMGIFAMCMGMCEMVINHADYFIS